MGNRNHNWFSLTIVIFLFGLGCATGRNNNKQVADKFQSAAEVYSVFNRSYIELDRYQSGVNEFVVILGHKTDVGRLAWAVYSVLIDARNNEYTELIAFYVLDKKTLIIKNVFVAS